MDRPTNATHTRTETNGTNRTWDRGAGNGGRAPQTSRLQKKQSIAGARSASQPLRHTVHYAGQPVQDSASGDEDGTKAPRKGALRKAIRRLLGRRPREPESGSTIQISPPRHGYHRSEPTGLPPTHSPGLTGIRDQHMSQRNFSVPIDLTPLSGLSRIRSPYAVEFPQSSRLKPLNLGNPFDAPGSQLRRRKTLPSVLITGVDAAAIKSSIDDAVEPSLLEPSQDVLQSQIGRAISTRGSDKRRSRSVTDLWGAFAERPAVPQRKRSDEIRYWRDSYQPNVLRASGFRISSVAAGPAVESEEETTPMPQNADPFDARAGATQASLRSQSPYNINTVDDHPFPALGTEISRDLEERVARLENGLKTFQASLDRLNAERNHRTTLLATTPEPRSVPINEQRARASSGGRTASFLAEDLQGDLEPTGYEYDYTDTLQARPATSPQQPRIPLDIPAWTASQPALDDPFVSPTPPPPKPPRSTHSASGSDPHIPQHTFRSLYEMLADERSARRRLEHTLRGLQREIAHLHDQVSSTSHVHSQRSSSYMPSSARLRDLLAGTEESPPRTTESRRRSLSGGGAGLVIDPRVVSRFSGSESEATPADSEGLETPYEAYQTPLEEHSRYRFGEREGAMF